MISLYEFVIMFGLSFLSIAVQNVYLVALLAGLLSKQIPERILKLIINSKRPTNAKNCNIVNKGGDYSMKTGFPSGHTTVSVFLFFYFMLNHLKHGRLLPIVILSAIMVVLIGIARISNHCHTPFQVFGGVLVGILMGSVFFFVERKFLMKYRRFQKDKNKVFNFIQST